MITSLITNLLINLVDAARGPHRMPGEPRQSTGPADARDVLIGHVVESLSGGTSPGDPVYLQDALRPRACYLLGLPGAGKTNTSLAAFEADVLNHIGCVIVDRRGDLVGRSLLRLAALDEPDIAERLVLLDPLRAEFAFPFNPLTEAGLDPTARAMLTFQIVEEQWGGSFGPLTKQALRLSLMALAHAGWTLLEIPALLQKDPRFRHEVMRAATDPSVRSWLTEIDQLSPSALLQQRAPVENKVSEWASRPELACIVGQRQSIGFRALLDQRSDWIILISLGADVLFGAADLLGNLLIGALTAALLRTERLGAPRTHIYLDEFASLQSTSGQFETLLSEGRRFGCGVCVSHQASHQLSGRLSDLVRDLSAVRLYYNLGLKDAGSVANECATGHPSAELRQMLMNQKPGECVLVQPGSIVRMKTLLSPDPAVAPEVVARLCVESLKRYARPRASVERELNNRAERFAGFAAGPSDSEQSPIKSARIRNATRRRPGQFKPEE